MNNPFIKAIDILERGGWHNNSGHYIEDNDLNCDIEYNQNLRVLHVKNCSFCAVGAIVTAMEDVDDLSVFTEHNTKTVNQVIAKKSQELFDVLEHQIDLKASRTVYRDMRLHLLSLLFEYFSSIDVEEHTNGAIDHSDLRHMEKTLVAGDGQIAQTLFLGNMIGYNDNLDEIYGEVQIKSLFRYLGNEINSMTERQPND